MNQLLVFYNILPLCQEKKWVRGDYFCFGFRPKSKNSTISARS